MLHNTSKKIAAMVFAFVLTCCFISMPISAIAKQNTGVVSIIINNQPVVFQAGEQKPVIITGRTYVPLRIISENLGAKVEWKNSTRQVIINYRSDSTGTIPANKSKDVQIIIDSEILIIPTDLGKPYISNLGRTMIPLRAVGEALDCEVNWNNGIVDIKSAAPVVAIPEDSIPTTTEPQQPADSSNLQMLRDLAGYRTNLKLINGSVINSADLANQNPASFSTEQLAAFKTYLEQLSKYQKSVQLPDGQVLNTADITILGDAYLTADQLSQWIESEIARLKTKMAGQGLPFKEIPDLAALYIRIGEEYGVRGDLAFCQAAKETGYWQFTGSVQPWQNNYCGLYATGSPLSGLESYNGADPNQVTLQAGIHGAVFASPEAGVEAHIQHLYAYATNKPLPAGKVLIDPRFSLVSKGIAPTWLKLNARWAVPGTTYGQSIIFDYWLDAANS